jgi:uncharacterized membrane protein YdjX (TVP38/TMEM64 family)
MLPHVPDPVWIFAAKIVGAIAGSAVSIAYLLPNGKREAWLRFAIGITAGLMFGTTVGLKLADEMGIADRITPFEMTLSGATLASLGAWWGLGVLSRLASRATK